jgi:hypothetical protein
MRHARSLAVVLSATCAIGVAGVPGFAQSNAVRWSALPADATGARDVVAVYHHAHAIADDVAPPANLSFPEMYRETIERMVRRSSMFRRQCVRLASAPHATVILKNAYRPTAAQKARATIRRVDGRLIAIVEIQTLGELAELIAHELEHVIEQLDGIDLSAPAALSGTGVRACNDGSFETTRAVRIGRLVAQQTREGN